MLNLTLTDPCKNCVWDWDWNLQDSNDRW